MLLIKYLIDNYLIQDYETKLSLLVLSAIDNILYSNSIEPGQVSEKFLKFYSKSEEKNKFVEKKIRVYGNDEIFLNKSFNFKETLLKSPTTDAFSFKTGKANESFIERLYCNNITYHQATLIASGFPSLTGKIIYANESATNLLNFPSVYQLIGVNFLRFFPQPLISQQFNFFNKSLLFSNTTEIIIPYSYIIDDFGYALEITLRIRATFFSQVPYFIINFDNKAGESFFLCSNN